MESQYARDKAGTFLHGEPSPVYEIDNKISIEYGFQPYMPAYAGFLREGYSFYSIYIGDYKCGNRNPWLPGLSEYSVISVLQTSGDDPIGLFNVLNAYMPKEQIQTFFDTYWYVTENKQGFYWEDVSAMYPKTLEFDFDGMHFVVNVQDVQRHIGGSSEVRIHLKGTYTCDGDITASSYAKDAYGNYLHGNSGEMAP